MIKLHWWLSERCVGCFRSHWISQHCHETLDQERKHVLLTEQFLEFQFVWQWYVLGEGTPILEHGREVPRWWPPFLRLSIRLGPIFYCVLNPVTENLVKHPPPSPGGMCAQSVRCKKWSCNFMTTSVRHQPRPSTNQLEALYTSLSWQLSTSPLLVFS